MTRDDRVVCIAAHDIVPGPCANSSWDTPEDGGICRGFYPSRPPRSIVDVLGTRSSAPAPASMRTRAGIHTHSRGLQPAVAVNSDPIFHRAITIDVLQDAETANHAPPGSVQAMPKMEALRKSSIAEAHLPAPQRRPSPSSRSPRNSQTLPVSCYKKHRSDVAAI